MSMFLAKISRIDVFQVRRRSFEDILVIRPLLLNSREGGIANVGMDVLQREVGREVLTGEGDRGVVVDVLVTRRADK